jgi:hypothetical protein
MRNSKFGMHSLVCTFFGIMAVAPTANARTTLLVEPGFVSLDCVLSAQAMQEAISSGAAIRNWSVISQNPGVTQLKFVKGAYKHIITVDVKYGSDWYLVTYKDSTNLNFKKKRNGNRYIHPRPITWMKNLSADIHKNTDNLCRNNSAPGNT